ncbi:terpene cyclase [Aspergillus udagawae]|uniref:Terpene cyclase n=1 Tax=Aspergillus udagawae TaxID=91492 RepID=A0A8E0R2B7_9EURO|nr:terpene cyclase [Aspergillus udagawae]GIC93128.1 terpene cyclase [Aspergillus udagawae]
MACKYSTLIDSSLYDREGLYPGMDLRRHMAGELKRLVLSGPKKTGAACFISGAVPECHPDRMEIIAYALEFGFIHDDVINTDVNDASLDEVGHALDQSQTGKIEDRGSDGKRQIVTQIMREMMAIDPERAMSVAKSWSSRVRHSSRRKEDTNFKTLEQFVPYRALDVGYMLWNGLVTFGCAITVPDEEEEEAKRLIIPALIQASLLNDLFSFQKEKNDASIQNAVLIVMNEHGCIEEARDILKKRIRLECANYVHNVKETNAWVDVSDELKRYINIMQYTLSGNAAWSTNCLRYNGPTKLNELQLLRGEHGLAKYPPRWSPENRTSGLVEGDCHESKPNELKRKRNGVSVGDEMTTNGTVGAKKPAHISQPSTDSIVLEDVVQLARTCDLPDLSNKVILQPYRYLTSLPSKGFRDQAIDSINKWLKVPPKSVKMIKDVVKMLHSASLMLDDLQDNSPLRRGKPSTHSIYGIAQTINSATYQYITATDITAQLQNSENFHIFVEELQQLHVGQSYDLYWTHNTLCPTIAEYLKMVDMKTGGLFRMLTRMMIAESPVVDKVSNSDMNVFICLLGRFFQIRDDYQNLASADYAKAKGFAEGLDEGKYSFTLIHCIQTLESQPELAGEMMQLRAFLVKRRHEHKLSQEAKREVLATMKKTESLQYTLSVLWELHGELEKEVEYLEAKFGEETFTLRVMLELLKV